MRNSFTGKKIRQAAAFAVAAGSVAVVLGCSPKPWTAPSAAVNDKVYSVTPDSVKTTAGIVTGEIKEMKVTERVEEGSGRIDTPAKLSGTLVLRNISADQTVRVVGGRLIYIDTQGKPIKLEADRTAPTIKISSSYGSPDQLDPGQEATQSVDAEFPVDALKAKRLKEIRLELSYIPSPLKEEKLNFKVSIGGQ